MPTPVRVNIVKQDKGGGGIGGIVGGALGAIGGAFLGNPVAGYSAGSTAGGVVGGLVDKGGSTQKTIEGPADESGAIQRRMQQASQMPQDLGERSALIKQAMEASTSLPDEHFAQVAPVLEQAYVKNEYQRLSGRG